MPRFWRGLFGPLVTTSPQVISGAISPGQQCWIGNLPRSTSAPSHTISWQGAEETTLGDMVSTCFSTGHFSHASFSPFGGSGSFRKAPEAAHLHPPRRARTPRPPPPPPAAPAPPPRPRRRGGGGAPGRAPGGRPPAPRRGAGEPQHTFSP